MHVPPSPGPVVQRATIDLGLTEPARVGAIEFLPGDRRRLRAAWFRVESTGQWLGSLDAVVRLRQVAPGRGLPAPGGHAPVGGTPLRPRGRTRNRHRHRRAVSGAGSVGPAGRSRRDGAQHAWPIACAPRLGASCVRRDDLGARAGDSAGHSVPGAVGAAARWLDRSPAARRAAVRRLADALRVQVAGSIAARNRAAFRARNRRPLACAGPSRHQPLRPRLIMRLLCPGPPARARSVRVSGTWPLCRLPSSESSS